MIRIEITDDHSGDVLAVVEAPTVADGLAAYLVDEGYDPEATAASVRRLYPSGPADAPVAADVRCPVRGIVVASLLAEVLP